MKNIKTICFLMAGIVFSNITFASKKENFTDCISQNDPNKSVKINLNLNVCYEKKDHKPLICDQLYWIVSNKHRSPCIRCHLDDEKTSLPVTF